MARERGFWKRKGRGGQVWYCRDPQTGKPTSTRCRDLTAAKVFRARREREAADPSYQATDPAASRLDAVMDAMIKNRRRAGRSAATLEIHRCKAGHILRILGDDLNVNQLRAEDISGYIDRRIVEGASRHTVKKELVSLKLALKLARGIFRTRLDDLFSDFSDGYEPRRRWLSNKEFAQLQLALPPARRIDVAFMALTGARLGEYERACVGDVRKTTITLRGTKTDQAPREVPVPPKLRPLLARLMRGRDARQRLFAPWINLHRDLKAACNRAGIPECTPNDLRRSFASWLRNAAVDASTVASLLGHASSKMVERVYGRIDLAAKARAIRPLASVPLVGFRQTAAIKQGPRRNPSPDTSRDFYRYKI